MEGHILAYFIIFLGIPALLFLIAMAIVIRHAGSILDETGHMATNVVKKIDKFLSE
jgi:hypothetical protein